MLNFEHVQVPPDGPLDARVAIVGEAPGKTEVELKQGFVGGSGKLLWHLLGDVGITREQCYVTNVVKDRPKDNRIDDAEIPWYDPTWTSMLQAELREVRPNLVIALGKTALNALCNTDENLHPMGAEMSILSWRGSVIPSTLVPGLKVLVAVHPALVLRQYQWRVHLATDLSKAPAEMQFPEIRRRQRTLLISPTRKEALDFINDITTPYATDVEIRNNEIACFSLSPSNDVSMSIPIMNMDLTPFWSPEDELSIWKAMARRLASPIPSIGQNYVFDLFWYLIYGMQPWLKQVYDTMLMANLINPELEKDLGTLCSIYTDHPFYKDDGKVWTPAGSRIPLEQFLRYNATDSIITREVWTEQCKELQELGLWDFYHNISMKLIPCVLKPMLRGLRVDLPRQIEVYDQYKEDIAALTKTFKEKVHAAIGRDVSPSSPAQMKDYLYSKPPHGLGIKEQRKDGKATVNEATLELLNGMYVIPGMDEIFEIREKSKIASTFLNPERNDVDGRSRCSYNIPGTDSGRMSSSKGPLGSGGNLQNITHGLCRSIYIPDTSMVWLEADESQAEVRIVAHIAPEPKLQALFLEGKDVHKFNAHIGFGVPYEEVTKPQRFVAKHLVHACDYDVQAKTFAATMNKKCRDSNIDMHMTTAQAQQKIDMFHAGFPNIKEWHKRTQQMLLENNCTLVNLLGRPHTFLDHYGPDMFRKAYNWQCQCCDDQTEVLTADGFVPFPELHMGHQVAQWWENGNIDYVTPTEIHEYDYDGYLYELNGKRVNQLVTPNHRIGYFTSQSFIVTEAQNLEQHQRVVVPSCGSYAGTSNEIITREFGMLLVATQADGSFTGNQVRWHFAKQRKIDRLKKLLTHCGFGYNEHQLGDGTTVITTGSGFRMLMDIWLPNKQFTAKLLHLPLHIRRSMIVEAGLWDGDRTGRSGESFSYSNTDKQSVDILQAIAVSSGFRAFVRNAGKKEEHHNDVWVLNVHKIKGSFAQIKQRQKRYKGSVYCVTVPSGFFIVRRNGKVSITGNSLVADIINIAWVRFDERYSQYAVMMQIHDALTIQCRMNEVDKVKAALIECFDIELESFGVKFKIPIEFKLTEERWSKMRDA